MAARFFYLLLVNIVLISVAQAKAVSESDKQIKCLALNIYFESRGEPMNGQFAVAAVTMNRVKSEKFPSTVCKVVWQRRQFSWTHDGKSDRPKDVKAWAQATTLAKLVYSKYLAFQAENDDAWDITQGALHYYAASLVQPYWAKEIIASTSIGRHTFVKL